MENKTFWVTFDSGFSIGIPTKATVTFLSKECEELREALIAFEKLITKDTTE